MAANISDKLTAVRSGSSNAVATTVSSARSIGGASLSCVDLTGWPTGSAVHFITYKKKSDGSIDRASQCDWKGIVSGTTIGSLTLKNGTDAGNASGDFVEMLPTAAWGQDLYDGLTQTLNNDGTLRTGIVTSEKLAPTKSTVDGWTCYDYGSWKEYVKLENVGTVTTTRNYFPLSTLPAGKTRADFYPTAFLVGTSDGYCTIDFTGVTGTTTSYTIAATSINGSHASVQAVVRLIER